MQRLSEIGPQGFSLICLLIQISQNKSLVNPHFQQMLSFAYIWYMASQSKGLLNLLSSGQRSDLLKRGALLRFLASKLFRMSPIRRGLDGLKPLLTRVLVQKVQKGLTLDILFSLSGQFLVMNPVQGNILSVLKFGLLLRIPEISFPFEDVDFTDFDPSFRDFLKELVLVSEIVRLFRQKNFVLEMILDTMQNGMNLEENFLWLKYVSWKYPIRDLNTFRDIFSRLTDLFKFESLKRYEPRIKIGHERKRGPFYPLNEAALVGFCIDLLSTKFVKYNNFCGMIDASQLSSTKLYSVFSKLRDDGLTRINVSLSSSIVPFEPPSKLASVIDQLSHFTIPQEYKDFLKMRYNSCLNNKCTGFRDCTEYRHDYASKFVRFMLILTKLVDMIQSRNAHFFQLLLLWQDAQVSNQTDFLFRSALVDLIHVIKHQPCCESEQFIELKENLSFMISLTIFEDTQVFNMLNFLFQYLSKQGQGVIGYLQRYMEAQTDCHSFFKSLDRVIDGFTKSRQSSDLTYFSTIVEPYDAYKRCKACKEARNY